MVDFTSVKLMDNKVQECVYVCVFQGPTALKRDD